MKNKKSEGIATYGTTPENENGLGPGSAGQSGDIQGLSGDAEAGPESVVELVEEGQAFEADVMQGVEDADGDGKVAEVHTRQFREDDVPDEYLNQD